MNIIDAGLKFNGAFTYGNIPNKIVLHNADASNCTVQDIHSWHLANGWIGIGYHYFVRKDGSIYKGRPDLAIGSHCQGSNTGSLGICFEGAYMTETMSSVQYDAGIELIKYMFNKYGTLAIYGHKELYNTDCPGINFPLNDFKNMKEQVKYGWIQNSTGWWYKNEDDSYPKNCWLKLDAWYSFDSQGYARQLKWIQDKGKWYWLKSDCRMACNETLHITGKEYSFNDKGEMI